MYFCWCLHLFLRCQALASCVCWASSSTDGLRLLVKRPGLAHVKRFWLALRLIEHFGDLFITKIFRLGFITAAEVDRRHFTTESTFAGAANFERTDISNRPNFVHEPWWSVHLRVCGCKWLHQVAWEFARTVFLSCSHLRIDVQRASAVAFCSSLRLEVAGVAAWTCQCVCARSEFQHRQSAQNSASHERAGLCSRDGAAKTCQRGPKGPGRSRSKMCARQKTEMWCVCHESRSPVYMIVGTWCLPMSMVTCSRKCIDSIRPSVLVKLSCRLCRLVPFLFCSAQSLRCSVRGHDYLQAASILLRQHAWIALHV